MGSNDNIQVTFGSSQDAIIEFDTVQTNDCLIVGVDSTSLSLIICDKADIATNFGIANQTNPTLFIHSADEATLADYISFTHDQTSGLITTGAGALRLASASGAICINETTDANVTIGLVINQGGNDDALLTVKSSDVTHAMTGTAEADTFGEIRKVLAASGGLMVRGYASVTGGLQLSGFHTTDNTTKGTTADGAVTIVGALRSGAGVTALGANANILVIRSSGEARVIFDAEGDAHQDGTGWTVYDDHDDVLLLNALNAELAADPLKAKFAQWIDVSRDTLEKARIVTFNEDGSRFINWSRTHMLVIGAIRQIGERLDRIEQRLLEA